jgi:hypothetical protein
MIASPACADFPSVPSTIANGAEYERPAAFSEGSPCILNVVNIGGQFLAAVPINENMTVLDGKRAVEQLTSVPFPEQSWILSAELLRDNQIFGTLYSDYSDNLVVTMIHESVEHVISRHTQGLSSACAESRERACQTLEGIGAQANGRAEALLGMLASEPCSHVFHAACCALAALPGRSMSGSLQRAWLTVLQKSLTDTRREQVILALLAAHGTQWMSCGCCPNVWDHLNPTGVMDRSRLMVTAARTLVADYSGATQKFARCCADKLLRLRFPLEALRPHVDAMINHADATLRINACELLARLPSEVTVANVGAVVECSSYSGHLGGAGFGWHR